LLHGPCDVAMPGSEQEMTFLSFSCQQTHLHSARSGKICQNASNPHWLAFIGLRKANLACSPFIIAKLLGLYCSILRHDKKDLRFNEYHDLPMTITNQPRDVVASHHPSNSLFQLSRFPARFETQVSRSQSPSCCFCSLRPLVASRPLGQQPLLLLLLGDGWELVVQSLASVVIRLCGHVRRDS
jgi:hypothetical protein